MSRTVLLPGAALALTLAAPLLAQETPAPAPERILPPIRYSLPPGETVDAPSQTPPPVVVTPPPVVAPVATPTPRAQPSTVATPRPRPTASPTPRATVAPAAEVPAPAETPLPDTVPADTAPIDTATAADPAPAPASNTPAAEPADQNGAGWLIALAAVLVAGFVAFVWWRRRSAANHRVSGAAEPAAAPPSEAEPTPAADPEPVSSPPPPPVVAAPAPRPAPAAAEADEPQFLSRPAGPPLPPRAPIPAGTITAFRDRPRPAEAGFITAFRRPAPTLGIELQPIRAGLSEDTGFVEFQFAFLNQSDQAVSDMMVSAWMLTANADQDAQIAAYLGEPTDPSQHTLYALQPGEHRNHRATMGEALDQLHVVEAAGRRFFAPILIIDARYRGAGGGQGRSTAAFVVGRPNPATGKLAPIYVDRGSRIVEGLAARPYPLPSSRAA